MLTDNPTDLHHLPFSISKLYRNIWHSLILGGWVKHLFVTDTDAWLTGAAVKDITGHITHPRYTVNLEPFTHGLVSMIELDIPTFLLSSER